MKTKLYRNLKPGDRIGIAYDDGVNRREGTVTVSSARETRPGHFSGRRQWAIHANYPWWFPGPIVATSTDRTEVLPPAKETAAS